MTNDELLEKLGKMMDATLDEKLKPITKRFETVEKTMVTKADLKHMATKTDIHDIAEDMAGFFQKTWKRGMKQTNALQPLKTS